MQRSTYRCADSGSLRSAHAASLFKSQAPSRQIGRRLGAFVGEKLVWNAAMKIFHSLDELDSAPSVVTIGNFDGVHRGHRMVIDTVTARSRELHAKSVAITFDPHPMRVLKPDA